ncbi:MAG: hypothetical protein JW715_12705 [Sedimentisphaerales bacterium]|nr:hypothetical protein [Sedimentisphaerales bacterium]
MEKDQADRIEKKLDRIIDFFSINAVKPEKTREEIHQEVVEFLQNRKEKQARKAQGG